MLLAEYEPRSVLLLPLATILRISQEERRHYHTYSPQFYVQVGTYVHTQSYNNELHLEARKFILGSFFCLTSFCVKNDVT